MHFQWTFTIGDIFSTGIFAGIIHIVLYLRRLDIVLFQHQLMWNDFKITHNLNGISFDQLDTALKAKYGRNPGRFHEVTELNLDK